MFGKSKPWKKNPKQKEILKTCEFLNAFYFGFAINPNQNAWQSVEIKTKSADLSFKSVLYQIFMLAIGLKELTLVSGVVFLDMTLSKVHTC